MHTHKQQGVPVHLFIRKTGKIDGGKAVPFVYCGDIEFMDWRGEQPTTVRWRVDPAPHETLLKESSDAPGGRQHLKE